MLVSMDKMHQSAAQVRGNELVFRASIALGIGDDDAVGAVAVAEHGSERDARAWVEAELPRAQFPDWVARRPHGTAGAFLYGQIECGWHAPDRDQGVVFEPDLDAPGWDADLLDGRLRWRSSP